MLKRKLISKREGERENFIIIFNYETNKYKKRLN